MAGAPASTEPEAELTLEQAAQRALELTGQGFGPTAAAKAAAQGTPYSKSEVYKVLLTIQQRDPGIKFEEDPFPVTKLLILSDSHNSRLAIENILAAEADSIDALIFLGDGLRDLEQALTFYPSLRPML